MTVAALIVAAGRGTRAGGGDLPKQFRHIGGKAVLCFSIEAFLGHAAINSIVIVIHPDDEDRVGALISEYGDCDIRLVHGGATRQQSVCAGLEALEKTSPGHVLIHDGARPFVDDALTDRVLTPLDEFQGAIPALPLSDTIKKVITDDNAPGVFETVDRQNLFGAQTPQGFRYGDILAAHRAARETNRDDFTDDASIAEWRGLALSLVEGTHANQKITTADDIVSADRKLRFENQMTENGSNQFEYRTGTGFDVHRFGDGDAVMLCGVSIPHSRGLMGHSDADVGLHAITDALLGTIGAGDIGQHFPPSDARWKGAASDQFLIHARELVEARSGRITHIDVTLICEAPKIGPHHDAMRARLAEILGIATDRVSVKATTSERLGFTGREEGMAALASATVALPLSSD